MEGAIDAGQPGSTDRRELTLRVSAKQLPKLIGSDTRNPQDAPQGPAIQHSMIGYHNLTKRLVAPQDHVAALLTAQLKARAAQCLQAILPGDDWKLTHTDTSNASKRSSGIGRRSSSNAATYC